MNKISMSLFMSTRLGMFLLMSGYYYSLIGEGEWQKKMFIFCASLLFVLNHVLLVSTSRAGWKITVCALDMVISATFGVLFRSHDTMYLILFGVIAVTLFLGTSKKKVLLLFSFSFFLIWGTVLFLTYKETGTIHVIYNVISFSFVIHGVMVGSLMRKLMMAKETIVNQYEQLTISHDQLMNAHQQLESYSQQVEELTMIRERNRIARDIHDTIGHYMTALLVQLRLAQEIVAQDPNQAKEAMKNSEELARRSLEDIRLSVRTLHEEEHQLTVIQMFRDILEEFSEMTGVKTVFRMEGDPVNLPPSLQLTMKCLVQEALTNAKRHGEAGLCEVFLHCFENQVRVQVRDDGIGVSTIVPGFGLVNMRERVEQHGGEIELESVEGKGFTIKVEFPLKTVKWKIGGDAK